MTKSIFYQGKEESLYFALNLNEDDEYAQESNFKELFAYSVLLDNYIKLLHSKGGSYYTDYAPFEFIIPCKLVNVEPDIMRETREHRLNIKMWKEYHDEMLLNHWDLYKEVSSKTGFDDPVIYFRNVLGTSLPSNMAYSKYYLSEKLTEMLNHKKIIINYMLDTFL